MKKSFRATQTVDRQRLLNQLKAVQPGIARKEIIEQSSCFVFHDGKVMTFNGEVACSTTCDFKFEGAIYEVAFFDILKKLDDKNIKIRIEKDKLVIVGESFESDIKLEKKICLPVDDVEIPKRWKSLPKDFDKAVRMTIKCASLDSMNWKICCVHFHPELIEACDNYQLLRYTIKTGVRKSRLVKASALKKMLGRKITHLSTTRNWLHFRNPNGLVISCRSRTAEYEKLDHILDHGGETVSLPATLEKALARASVFKVIENHPKVELSAGKMSIHIDGYLGRYEEDFDTDYSADPLVFHISLYGLLELTKLSNHYDAEDKRVKFCLPNSQQEGEAIPGGVGIFESENFVYAVSISVVRDDVVAA